MRACKTRQVCGKTCHIYHNSANEAVMPIFYWGIAKEDKELIRAVVSFVERQMNGAAFLLVTYEVEHWNDDFSPWEAKAVFGEQKFGGKATDTILWLTQCCIPEIESADAGYIEPNQMTARFLVGYSLAGLFSMWAYFESTLFDGVVSCSGSFWFSGWEIYVTQQIKSFCRKKEQYVYISLGTKEEKTRNRQMATVGENTRALYDLLKQKSMPLQTVLEWNTGGHFSEPDIRIAKGIRWILCSMQQCDCNKDS